MITACPGTTCRPATDFCRPRQYGKMARRRECAHHQSHASTWSQVLYGGEMLTRRHFLQFSALTAAGYAMAAEPILAQAIRTDTVGLVAGDVSIKSGNDTITAYEAHPDKPVRYPVVVVISEIWGLHEYIRDVARRFGKENFYAIAPELFQREGGVTHLTDVQEILKIVLNVPRQQVLQDLSATANYARGQSAAIAERVGVTGFCWGGSTTIQYASYDNKLGAAVAWYGPPGQEYKDDPKPVSGFDVAKDITCPFLGLFGEEDKKPYAGRCSQIRSPAKTT
jgi:carboxymethylenebutenolidase